MKRPDSLRPNRWQVAPPVPDAVRHGLDQAHPILAQLLYNRGITDAAHVQAFLDGRYLESTDPFLLPDMETAVARIARAIADDELIVVYGDFDADGVTATVLLTQALRGLGLERRQVRPYIPDRVDEGYGLNAEALTSLREMDAGLVISVDCGIRSIKEVEHARAIGLDMIITDHHSLGPALPPATAVINPKHPDSTYPDQMLAGVGIAYKLAQALRLAMPERAQFDAADLLDLVALGTVADLAPLLRENRKLVQDGLRVLNRLERPGLAALAEVAGLRKGGITSESIAFGLGPRINAAGRLTHAYDAAKLLASNNSITARQLAQMLHDLNRKRQRITAEMSQVAEALIDPAAPILIAGDPSFLPGVVGLVASRLAEQYYRPAIILEMGAEESRGSCRSIPEFHITDALDETADLLERHGGHAQAAGFTVRNENLAAFKARMLEIAAARLRDKELLPTLAIDAEIALDDVDWALHGVIEQLEPLGYANPAPIFLSRGVEVISHRTVGADGAHLQLRLAGRDGPMQRALPAIAFRQGAWAAGMPQLIDIVYAVGVNEWNGQRDLQLNVQDIQPGSTR
jgi:single-stranded-DNA-specific exonuclease